MSLEKHIFELNGYIFCINQELYENIHDFYTRITYIKNELKNNFNDYSINNNIINLINSSHVYLNQLKGCEYL